MLILVISLTQKYRYTIKNQKIETEARCYYKESTRLVVFFYNYICLYFYQNVEIFFAQSTFNNVINSGGGRGEEESIAMAY